MTTTEPTCVPRTIDEALDPDVRRRPFGRRGALRAAGAAVMAGVVTACYGSGGSRVQNSPCCNLARSRMCEYQVSYDRYSCPTNYYRTLWSCEGPYGDLVWCGECSDTGSCLYSESYYCSTWFYNANGSRRRP